MHRGGRTLAGTVDGRSVRDVAHRRPIDHHHPTLLLGRIGDDTIRPQFPRPTRGVGVIRAQGKH